MSSVTTTIKNPTRQDIGRALGEVRHQLGVVEHKVRATGWTSALYQELCRLEREERDLSVTYGMWGKYV